MRITDIITETPRSDRVMRDTAARIFRSLYLHRNQPLYPAAIDIGDGIKPVAYTPTILPDLIVGVMDLSVPTFMATNEIQSSIPRRFRYLIAFPARIDRPRILDMRTAITIAARSLPPKVTGLLDAMAGTVENFVHEFTHYWDTVRAGRPIPSTNEYYQETSSAEAGPAYFNDPSERNAYLNQMLSNIDKAPVEFYQIPFVDWLKRIARHFPSQFLRNLEPRNRHRILARLYQVWKAKQGT